MDYALSTVRERDRDIPGKREIVKDDQRQEATVMTHKPLDRLKGRFSRGRNEIFESHFILTPGGDTFR